MTIQIEPLAPSAEVIALLQACELPSADIATSPILRLLGHRVGSTLVGTVALEIYPPDALLRSAAVLSAHRGAGIARALVAAAETEAAALGIRSLYLLTETAERFFLKLGYGPVNRADVPTAIRATAEFTKLCPASARCLRKMLA